MTAVVVPVHNAPEATRRCLAALTALAPSHPVIVIDDASTGPDIQALMAELPSDWVRIRNDTNLGFTGTANLGFCVTGQEDVILLNSDTQVTAGWLAAIEACAATDPRIASITPLTNNGEIASIPRFCHPNPWPDDAERWAQACRQSGAPIYPEVPTGVGFCMYFRRACLDEIGVFDEQAFGRGYGEENDWCMRAIKAGWRHVLCDSAYVAHEGNASFGPLGLGPGGKAMETLLSRHPDYLQRVQAFIQADPMAERREAIVRW
ncbi:MAG: glycosyltransferase family 2 protein, partial [Wenzhouxiangella sp.]